MLSSSSAVREAESFETIYCEEDEYIIDPETGDEVENPEYFEPYDETIYEDIIHGQNGFDDIFYEASGYLEELLELRAQFLCKRFARDIELHTAQHPDLTQKMREILPASAFDITATAHINTRLSSKIKNAALRTTAPAYQEKWIPVQKEPE